MPGAWPLDPGAWPLDPGAWPLHGGVAQLGEHLLCKQGVVGSIPIASRAWLPPGLVALGSGCLQVWLPWGLGVVTGWMGLAWSARVGACLAGLMGSAWVRCTTAVGPGVALSRCVRVVFMDCESGSGALWARRASRVVSAMVPLQGCMVGRWRGVRGLLAWGV